MAPRQAIVETYTPHFTPEPSPPVAHSRIPLLIIGAGPHALALLLSILEEDRRSECTETESINLAFWRRRMGFSRRSKHGEKARCEALKRNIRVVDPSGQWLHKWNSNFESFDIPFLRSPTAVHLDPLRNEALRDFAAHNGRLASDIIEPPECIHFSKRNRAFAQNTSMFNESQRQFFGCPSSKIFREFNQELIEHYGVGKMVERSGVVSLEPAPGKKGFIATLDDGERIHADMVVAAIGTQNIPRLPAWATEPIMATSETNPLPAVMHAWDFPMMLADVKASITSKRLRSVLVIGGGLTSVHISKQLIKNGIQHVTLMTRKERLAVQPYDVALDWVAPTTRQKKQSEFYETDDPVERLAMVRAARQGGSVTQAALDELNSVATPDNYSHLAKCTVHAVEKQNHSTRVTYADELHGKEVEAEFDLVILATGSTMDISRESLFFGVKSILPDTPMVGGFPVLDKDLRWTPDRDLFLIGGYAALQLGPVAGNLMGALLAASRLTERVLEEMPPLERDQARQASLQRLSRMENLYAAFDSDSQSETEDEEPLFD